MAQSPYKTLVLTPISSWMRASGPCFWTSSPYTWDVFSSRAVTSRS